MSIFSNLRTALEQRLRETQQQELREWKSFVEDVADGREADANAILIALEQAKKTPDDLQSAVELLQRRRAMVAEIAECQQAEAELPGCEVELTRLRDEFGPIRQQFEEAERQAEWKIKRRREKRTEVHSIRRKLVESAGPEYHAQLKTLREQIEPHNREIRRLRELSAVRTRELEAAIRGNTPGFTNVAELKEKFQTVAMGSSAQLSKDEERVQRIKDNGEAEIQKIEDQISELSALVSDLEREFKTIEESMLDPLAI